MTQSNREGSKNPYSESLTSLAESLQSGKSFGRSSSVRRKGTPQSTKKLDPKSKNELTPREAEELKFYKVAGVERYNEDEEAAPLRKEREEARKQKQAEALRIKMRIQEEKDKEEKKKNLKKQVGNKEYTYDFEGNPIFLTHAIKLNKLPNNESVLTKFDLNSDIRILKSLPDVF